MIRSGRLQEFPRQPIYDAEMDTKSFLIGAASGVLVFAAVSWVRDADQENGLPEAPSSEATPTTAPNVGLPVAKEERTADSSPTMQSTDRVTSSKQSEARQTPATEAHDQPIADSDIPDRSSGLLAGRRTELEVEPKDDGWAYYMEQAILQFLTSHPAITQFDISYIDCRTTVCNIQVIGYDESTGPTWHRIIYDLRQQPWSEFEMWGSSVFIEDGRPVTRTRLHRQQNRN